MNRMYRNRAKGSHDKGVKKSVALSKATMEGLDAIRNSFRSKYPLQSYPTLSAVLELVLSKDIERLQDADELAVEVEFFKTKYSVKTDDAPTKEGI